LTPHRLKYLEQFPNSCTERDIESLETLMLKFPYFSTPFVILAKVYHDQQNYKASEILKKASLRVFNRAELYNYIHLDNSSEFEMNKNVLENKSIPLEDNSKLQIDNSNTSLVDIKQPMEDDSAITGVIEIQELPDGDNIEIEQKVENNNSIEKPIGQSEENNHTTEIKDLQEEEFSQETVDNESNIEKIEESNKVETEISTESNEIEVQNETLVKDTFEIIIEQSTNEQNSTEDSTIPVNFFDWISKIDSSEPKEIKTSAHVMDALEGEDIQLINTLPNNKSKGFSLPANEAIDLIDEFIRKSPQISRPKKEFFKAEKVAQKSLELSNEIVTETLAAIYAKQGHWEQAIAAYQKLSLKFPQKQTYFAAIIEELKTKKEL
jgi:tetratricopeptide (TPR) repeat protein